MIGCFVFLVSLNLNGMKFIYFFHICTIFTTNLSIPYILCAFLFVKFSNEIFYTNPKMFFTGSTTKNEEICWFTKIYRVDLILIASSYFSWQDTIFFSLNTTIFQSIQPIYWTIHKRVAIAYGIILVGAAAYTHKLYICVTFVKLSFSYIVAISLNRMRE